MPTNSLVRSTGLASTVTMSTAVGGRAAAAGPAPVAPPLPHAGTAPRKRTIINAASHVRHKYDQSGPAASAEHVRAIRLDAIDRAGGSWTEESVLTRETVQALMDDS